MTKDFINPLTGSSVSQTYYNRVMKKIACEKAMEEEKLEWARIRLERMLNNRHKHLPPPVQQFVVVNDKEIEDKKIATRTGLKRKVINRPKVVKTKKMAPRTGLKSKIINRPKRRIIKGLRTGLKRKTIRIPKKLY